ncbi:phage tail tape measure protein [Paraburkholderia xenovorans]|uniref:phage tail tape measure protein n=1 Tax=Paraburkholderia xenovorans TaxID=36873 RepID=UPI001559A390|nr:phage tail tape measure protein [Paraburkholderia xenovorans]
MAKATKANKDFMTIERLKAEAVRAAEQAVSEAQANAAAKGETLSNQQVNQIKRTVTAWAQLSQRMQYSKADIRDMLATQYGIGTSTEAMRAGLTQSAAAADKVGHSSAAVRKEIIVLAHEAATGSWKNFVGSFLVLGERIDLLGKVASPAGVGLAAVAAVAAAFAIAAAKGYQESERLNAALANTGGFAGRTAGQVNEVADALGGISGGVTKAQDVLAGLIETGKFSGDTLESVAKSVLVMSEATGQDADKVIDSYAKMSDGVAKWADEQNQQYHFLSLAQYEHIKALEDMGEKGKAEKAVADALTDALGSQQKQLGWLPAAWHAVGDAAESAWRKMMNLGKPTAAEDKLADLQEQLATAKASLASNEPQILMNGAVVPQNQNALKAQIADLQNQISNQQAFVDNEQKFAAQQAQNAQIHQAAIDADNALSKSIDSLDKGYAKSEALRKLYQQFAALKKEYENTGVLPEKYQGVSFNVHTGDFSGGLYDKAVADINDRYKQTPKHQKAYTDDAATRMLQEASQTQATLEQQLDTHEKIGVEQEKQVKFEQMIADLKTKKSLTADQKSLLASFQQVDVALRQNTELEKQVAAQQALNKLKAAAVSIDADIASYQQSQTQQYDRQLSAIGMGSDAQKQAEAVKSIYAKYQQEQEKLNKAARDTGMSNSVYTDETAKIQAGLQQSLKDYSTYYAALKEKERDWTNGAATAMADYLDDANNRMKQTERLFDDVTGGMEDAWVNFAQTGKLSFASLTTSVLADLDRMAAKAAISGLLGSLASIGGSLAGGYFSSNTGVATVASNALSGDSLDNLMSLTKGFGTYAAGGVLSGPGSGTSDSILIRASNGEGILTAATVDRLGGASAIDALNRGGSIDHLARYATGGVVGAVSTVSPRASGTTVALTVQTSDSGGGLTADDAKWLQGQLKNLVDARIAAKMKGQGGYAWQQKWASV